MRKIFSLILFIVLALYSTFYSKTTEATGITPTMEVTLDKAYQGSNGSWNWKFNIKTTYTPDNTKVSIETFELVKKISSAEATIKNNSATYTATDLKSGQAYLIYFTLGNYNPIIKKQYSGTPGPTSQKPQVSSFSPIEGKTGDIVTITGNYFNNIKNVFFGIKSADISKATISNTEIKVQVPDGATTGKITVKNSVGETISSQIFKITSDPVGVDPEKKDVEVNSDIYKLLAPIGDLTEAPNDVGKYFNIIFKIAIGLCAVLAVIMIVIGGIGYMGSESVFGKTEAKGKIGAAILGLIIALGAYALLNTINPDLLGEKGVNIEQVSAGIEEDVTDVGSGVNVGGSIVKISKGKAVACKGGIVSIPSNMGSGKICKDLLDKLKILQTKYSGWKITSAIRGHGAASSCHYNNYQNSGNCADLQITNNPRGGYNKQTGSTNTSWGDFCVAVAQVGGLNYLNEASSVINCQNIQKYKAYPQTTGPHLHVNLIN